MPAGFVVPDDIIALLIAMGFPVFGALLFYFYQPEEEEEEEETAHVPISPEQDRLV